MKLYSKPALLSPIRFYSVGPPFTIAKLVQLTPRTIIYYAHDYSIHGFINQSMIRGSHIAVDRFHIVSLSYFPYSHC